MQPCAAADHTQSLRGPAVTTPTTTTTTHTLQCAHVRDLPNPSRRHELSPHTPSSIVHPKGACSVSHSLAHIDSELFHLQPRSNRHAWRPTVVACRPSRGLFSARHDHLLPHPDAPPSYKPDTLYKTHTSPRRRHDKLQAKLPEAIRAPPPSVPIFRYLNIKTDRPDQTSSVLLLLPPQLPTRCT